MKYFIKEDYYFDIEKNQLRIAGPANHLFLGLTIPKDIKFEISDYKVFGRQVQIYISTSETSLDFTIPVVTDIRTIRSYTEPVDPTPTYEELVINNVEELIPEKIEQRQKKGWEHISFVRNYTDLSGKNRKYGAEMIFPKSSEVKLTGQTIKIKSNKKIKFKIRTISNIHIEEKLQKPIFASLESLPEALFSPYLMDIYRESESNIVYLIRTKKTSSFEYGTIFPRDWIESADLGQGDLSEETIDYMYVQSLKNISEYGEGWHEEAIGEFKTKNNEIIDRKMVDIEPHYIMGMEIVSKDFLTRRNNQKKLRLVADFILNNAREKNLISFKRKDENPEEYHMVGNWRDSVAAYPNQKSPFAPYDVNCVFYPTALRLIKKFRHFFRIKNLQELDELIVKWGENKDKFRIFYKNGTLISYCLALNGPEEKKLNTPQLDESYDLFYGDPSMEEVVGFSEKLTDPKYLFTPVGPLLVGAKSKIYNHKNYHGKVIWPKQAAFSVAGLTRQYKRGLSEGWPMFVLSNLRDAIVKTARACFKGWTDLGTVPELYYYDEYLDKARFFTDQENYVGQMSVIQLWSSVAARRIMRDYAYVISNEKISQRT